MLPKRRRNRSVVAWLVCLAIWANAFAPAIAHATAAARGLPLVVAELCSARGSGTVPIWRSPRQQADREDTPSDGPLQRDGPAAGHCAACLASGDPAGLPAAQSTAFLPAPAHWLLPAFAPAFVAPPVAWSPANPRAPPTARG